MESESKKPSRLEKILPDWMKIRLKSFHLTQNEIDLNDNFSYFLRLSRYGWTDVDEEHLRSWEGFLHENYKGGRFSKYFGNMLKKISVNAYKTLEKEKNRKRRFSEREELRIKKDRWDFNYLGPSDI